MTNDAVCLHDNAPQNGMSDKISSKKPDTYVEITKKHAQQKKAQQTDQNSTLEKQAAKTGPRLTHRLALLGKPSKEAPIFSIDERDPPDRQKLPNMSGI